MPKLEKKQAIVNEIKEKFEKSTSVVLIDARGLTVEQDTSLRKKLRAVGVEYKVYKNTMLDLAATGTKYEGLKEYFKGPSTVAICYDEPTIAARTINKELKALPKLTLKAGVLDDVVYDEKGMLAVANIAPREELLSKLLGSFKSPVSSFARVIQAIADKEQ